LPAPTFAQGDEAPDDSHRTPRTAGTAGAYQETDIMANWRKLAKDSLLADGKIDAKEVKILREELFADHKIDRSEVDFLQQLREEAAHTAKSFVELFIDAVKTHILADGKIDAAEAKWLRKTIFADGKVDENEKRLMKELKAGAKKTHSEFEKLYKECMAAR
jgi:uncharacterized tellurite resistance protein B-like protein